jgi:hypothetical protein
MKNNPIVITYNIIVCGVLFGMMIIMLAVRHKKQGIK